MTDILPSARTDPDGGAPTPVEPGLRETGPNPRSLTPHVSLKRVVLLINPLSGSVGPSAAEEAAELLSGYACETEIVVLEGRFDAQIDAVLKSKPDLVAVLAGDGTARFVAARAGADGPLIAPLPGGTMNMLPKALYGTTDWKEALTRALGEGEPQFVSGGTVDGEPFYCVAVLGSPALWAPAREAMRIGKLRLAWAYARRALRRAWSGQVRFVLDGGRRQRAEALVLISPMISRAMEEPVGLEAAAMDPAGAADAFRLAAHALFDDWRRDPAVTTRPIRRAVITARSRIPALVDGETILLGHQAVVTFTPKAFRALAPRPAAAEDSV